MKKTAVVILNYNGKHFLEKFLKSVVDLSPEADVVIVDNASTDGSTDYLNHVFPFVKLIILDKNYGFAEGYNLGLNQLNHEYFILLNSDVEVTPNWISPLLNLAENHKNTVAIQPKILDYNRRTHFEYAGAAGGYMDIFGYAFCKGRVFENIEKDTGQYDVKNEIFWASGACLFIKAEVFKTLKGFDERFFAHMEEIDLCWRIHNKGYKIMYQPQSLVYHVGGGTLTKENPFKTYLNFRNNLAMMFKNLPTSLLFPLIFIRLCLDGVSGLRLLLNGQFRDVFAIIKAHFSFYSWVPYLLKRRSQSFIGFNKLYNGSIIWQYFVKGKKTYQNICSK